MSQTRAGRYADKIAAVLSCYDGVKITGTLAVVCCAEGLRRYLITRENRIFDYPESVMPLRDRLRDRATELAAEAGMTIEHIAKAHIRRTLSRRYWLNAEVTRAWCR